MAEYILEGLQTALQSCDDLLTSQPIYSYPPEPASCHVETASLIVSPKKPILPINPETMNGFMQSIADKINTELYYASVPFVFRTYERAFYEYFEMTDPFQYQDLLLGRIEFDEVIGRARTRTDYDLPPEVIQRIQLYAKARNQSETQFLRRRTVIRPYPNFEIASLVALSEECHSTRLTGYNADLHSLNYRFTPSELRALQTATPLSFLTHRSVSYGEGCRIKADTGKL